MMIRQIYRFTCHRCGQMKELNYPYYIGDPPPAPSLPAGWKYADPRGEPLSLICDKHDVTYHITDKIPS